MLSPSEVDFRKDLGETAVCMCVCVTKCVAVRCQNFGSKVRTRPEQMHQPGFDRVVQMCVDRCLQRASGHEERLDAVLV